tara:strand:+ start:649 stop:831 length:183 start_codon:yes stop_codon:yes gene_type:complete
MFLEKIASAAILLFTIGSLQGQQAVVSAGGEASYTTINTTVTDDSGGSSAQGVQQAYKDI